MFSFHNILAWLVIPKYILDSLSFRLREPGHSCMKNTDFFVLIHHKLVSFRLLALTNCFNLQTSISSPEALPYNTTWLVPISVESAFAW